MCQSHWHIDHDRHENRDAGQPKQRSYKCLFITFAKRIIPASPPRQKPDHRKWQRCQKQADRCQDSFSNIFSKPTDGAAKYAISRHAKHLVGRPGAQADARKRGRAGLSHQPTQQNQRRRRRKRQKCTDHQILDANGVAGDNAPFLHDLCVCQGHENIPVNTSPSARLTRNPMSAATVAATAV